MVVSETGGIACREKSSESIVDTDVFIVHFNQKHVFKLVGCVLWYGPPYAEVVTQSVHSAVTPHQLLAKTVSCHRMYVINALLSSARSLLCTKPTVSEISPDRSFGPVITRRDFTI